MLAMAAILQVGGQDWIIIFQYFPCIATKNVLLKENHKCTLNMTKRKNDSFFTLTVLGAFFLQYFPNQLYYLNLDCCAPRINVFYFVK